MNKNIFKYIFFILLFILGLNSTYAYEWNLNLSKIDYKFDTNFINSNQITISFTNSGVLSSNEFGDYDLNGNNLDFINKTGNTFDTYCGNYGYDKLFTKSGAFKSGAFGNLDAYLCIKNDGTFKILVQNKSVVGIYNNNNGTITGKFDTITPTVTDDYAKDNVWDNSSSKTITLSPSDTGGSGIKETKYCKTTSSSCTPDTVGTSLTVTANYNGRVEYQTWDNAGNTSGKKTIIIKLDKSAPNLTNLKKILIEATGSINFSTSTYDNDTGGSGLDQYKINLFSGSTALTTNNYSNLDTSTFTNNELKIIDSDGVNNLKLKMQVKDKAGNESATGTVLLDVIAGEISGFSSNFYEPTNKDYKEYNIQIKDNFGNIVKPISNIRKTSFTGSFINTTKFLNLSNGTILYYKDNLPWVSNSTGDSFSGTYTSGKIDGKYSIKVKSLVPTDSSGYKYVNGNLGDINLKDFIVKEENISNSNYDTTSVNSNYNTLNSSSSNIHYNNLNFDAPLHIDLQASSTFREGNNGLKVTLTNTTNSTFILKNFKLLFVHEKDVDFSPNITVSGSTIITDSGSYNNINRAYTLNVKLNNSLIIGTGSLNTKILNLTINANLYRQDLGKIGYLSFIPQNVNNSVYLHNTSYNTSSFGLNNNVDAYSIYKGSQVGNSYTSNGTAADISTISIAGKTGNIGKTAAINNPTGDNSSIFIDNGGIDKAVFKRNIKKSVASFTKGLTRIKYQVSGISIDKDTINSKKVLYYDFSDTDCSPINGNKGCVLNLDSSLININGIHTIIVRGGSIYIKSNMSYVNKNSLLGIIVLKDNKKGGNVYIDPSITNVVGTIYSEGSVMSYDGNTTDINSLNPILGKQLHIYGNLFTENTVGGSYGNIPTKWKCPYGSDYYEANNDGNCTNEGDAQKYDLARLRNMVLVNDGTGTGAMKYGTTTNEVITNGLAGGVTYTSNATTTDLINPTNNSAIIVEYNPQIQFLDLPGFIIK